MLMDIRVLLVDDHALLREGLHMVLDAQPGIAVIGEAEDGYQALEMVEKLHPDVVVMDIVMPRLNGLDATRQIRRRFPTVQIVILTMYESKQYVRQIVQSGAVGCVLKRSAGTELVAAVRAATRGEEFFAPAVASYILEDYRTSLEQGGPDRLTALTPREHEVLRLVVNGCTNRDIAERLHLSLKTVQTHRAHLMTKLDAHDRTDLVRRVLGRGSAMVADHL